MTTGISGSIEFIPWEWWTSHGESAERTVDPEPASGSDARAPVNEKMNYPEEMYSISMRFLMLDVENVRCSAEKADPWTRDSFRLQKMGTRSQL